MKKQSSKFTYLSAFATPLILSSALSCSHAPTVAEHPLTVNRSPAEVSVSDDLQNLRKAFFHEAYLLFVPAEQKEIHNLNVANSPQLLEPEYRPDSDREQWLQTFVNSVAVQLPNDALKQNFSHAIYYNLQTYSHGATPEYLYSKIPYLAPLSPEMAKPYQLASEAKPFKTYKVQLPKSYPDDLTLDLTPGARDRYLHERFPASLQSFISQNKVRLVMDDGPCDEAYALQIQQGFESGYKFMSHLDAPDSQYYLLQSTADKSYRFLSCEMYGEWDQKRIMSLLGPIFSKNEILATALLIKHSGKRELFNFASANLPLIRLDDPTRDQQKIDELKKLSDWNSITPKPDSDIVIMGYMNTVWAKLSNPNSPDAKYWTRTSVVWSGIDVALFLKRDDANNIQRMIVSVENVYGDEMNLALETFWNKGFRKFVYLGSTGGIRGGTKKPDLAPGDVLVPDFFQNFDVRTFTQMVPQAGLLYSQVPSQTLNLVNDAKNWKFSGIVGNPQATSKVWRKGIVQGNVPTLMVETVKFVNNEWERQNVAAIDVETFFFAQFFATHRTANTKTAVALIVSDLPLIPGDDLSEHKAGALSGTNVGHIISEILGVSEI